MTFIQDYYAPIVWALFLVGIFILFRGTPRDPLEFEDEKKLDDKLRKEAIQEVMSKIVAYSGQIRKRYGQHPPDDPGMGHYPAKKRKKQHTYILHDETYSKRWN